MGRVLLNPSRTESLQGKPERPVLPPVTFLLLPQDTWPMPPDTRATVTGLRPHANLTPNQRLCPLGGIWLLPTGSLAQQETEPCHRQGGQCLPVSPPPSGAPLGPVQVFLG